MGKTSGIIGQITSSSEEDRRQSARERGRIYKDGGKDFLIERLKQEFGIDALNEMRLAPVNILKSIVDRKSIIYARPPVRKAMEESDQALVDEYVEKLGLDSIMQKANRYFNLYSNTELYVIPGKPNKMGKTFPSVRIMPPWLYSVIVNDMDPTEKDWIIFSNFTDEDDGLPRKEIIEVGSISTSKSSQFGNGIDNKGMDLTNDTPYIFWSDDNHFTTNAEGVILVDPNNPDGINPIGINPAVTLRKDVDNEFWAMQGEDLKDLAIVIQQGLSDELTIAKMQGFGLLVVTGTKQPQSLEIGLQKAVFLQQKTDEPTPTVSYVTANAPLGDYGRLMDRIMELSSVTNLMPASIFSESSNGANSGIQEMLKQSATMQEIESQKPLLRDAEMESWDRIAAWHNLLHDKNELPEDLRQLGKFSDDFRLSIMFQDMKPMESEENRLAQVEKLMDLGLLTKSDALKRLNPEMSEEEIDAKLADIAAESAGRLAQFLPVQPVGPSDGRSSPIQEESPDEG